MSKYKMTCSVTGLTYATNAVGREKLLKRYGSEEALLTDYTSRLAKRLLKDGLTVDEIKAKVESGEITSKTKPVASTKTKKAKVKKVAEKVPELVIEDDADIDPDISAFLQPEGDASDKAL